MKWISTTIKKKWMVKILSGEKTIEYKGATDFWRPRLDKIMINHSDKEIGINFLYGRVPYKYKVENIYYYYGDRVIDGVLHHGFYEIHLGDRITEKP